MISGWVCTPPELRYSPAGIPVGQFALEHRSRQTEAGLPREAYCRVGVVASGEALRGKVESLALGSLVRVTGFLSRTRNRRGESRLVLHVIEIDLID